MSKLVIVSNRVPKIFDNQPNAGGLVNGIIDAIQNIPCTWIGWNGEINSDTSKSHLYKKDNIQYITTSLNQQEYHNYYCQFANQVLWPVFHARVDLCRYEEGAYKTFLEVNERLAKLVLLSSTQQDKIWIHDYHLLPLAKACRKKGMHNSIGFFLHIPFPEPTLLKSIPNYLEILEAMLAYDLIGFQTTQNLKSFIKCIKVFFPAIKVKRNEISINNHLIKLGVYPVGIAVDKVSKIIGERKVDQLLALSQRKIIINADRLDYIKGLLNSVNAYERLLKNDSSFLEQTLLYHINALSREYIPDYQDYRTELEQQITSINQQFKQNNIQPIHYTNKALPRNQLLTLLNIADVGLITSVNDGMNLIAKEFVASQTKENPGVLVLSKYTGVAEEFSEGALLVDPYSLNSITKGLETALSMPLNERKSRHKTLYRKITKKDAQYWFDSFLADLPHSTVTPQAISY